MDSLTRNLISDLLSDVHISTFNDTPPILQPPMKISPLEYAGLPSAMPEMPEYVPDILKISPTPPTSTLEPVRDLITGEIIRYRDSEVLTVSSDSSSTLRTISNTDDYFRGSSSAAAFLPGGFEVKQRSVDVQKYVDSLDTGFNLLSSPTLIENSIEETLPENSMEEETPTETQKLHIQKIESHQKKFAVVDDYDISKFSQDVPFPVLGFPFALDDFQIRSIYRLEQNQPVFVSAPTSSGKTAIAQYAIALAKSHKMRVIYTSPIKALSNQKFRDLYQQFKDVGILTGDVSIRREAACLVMTTEILRSMLYHGADVLRDVETVIFDECHYISNDARGVIWEECIILLPPHINMVFLSATVPNALEISDWIGRTKQRMLYLQNHTTRPVPLEHCLYTTSLHSVFSSSGKSINQLSYTEAKLTLCPSLSRGERWRGFLDMAQKKNLLPMLVFSFSQRKCEDMAEETLAQLLEPGEIGKVETIVNRALLKLDREERGLNQVISLTNMLRRGVAVHHGGILPILKELVEILLSEGLVKILFCTSTFAMGINVPARSCAFLSLEKFNGKEFVKLTPAEYIQMSGRAGRRGLDSAGTSIIVCFDEIPKQNYLAELAMGSGEALRSMFKLRFNTILNILRTRDIGMVDMLRRSLSANLLQAKMPQLLADLKEAESKLNNIPEIQCVLQDIEDMSNFAEVLNYMKEQCAWLISQSDTRKLFVPGKVLFIADPVGYAVVMNQTECITESGEVIKYNREDTLGFFGKQKFLKKFTHEIALDMIRQVEQDKATSWTKIIVNGDIVTIGICQEMDELLEELRRSPCLRCSLKNKHLEQENERNRLRKVVETIKNQVHDESVALKPLLDVYIDVLENMNYIKDKTLLLRGRVALEIKACHEILATELLFHGVFDDTDERGCAALVASLCSEGVFTKNEFSPFSALKPCIELLEQTVKRVFKIFCDFGVDVGMRFMEENMNFSLVEAVYIWSQGVRFLDVMQWTDVPEGTVVRVFTRVAEALKDLSNAAKIMGSRTMAEKFERAVELVRRDIVLASSLYFD